VTACEDQNVNDEPNAEEVPSVTDIVSRAAIQASPRLAGSLSILYDGFRQRWLARAREVVDEVEKRVPSDLLSQRLVGSQELDATFLAAVEAGASSGLEAKRRLLGKVVAEAVLDDAKVDHATLITHMLAQIDAPHIRCLEAIYRAKKQAAAAGQLSPTARGAEQPIHQDITNAGRAYPAPVLVALVSLGLLDASVTWDGVALVKGPTTFGQHLLDELRTADS
jgi:hypothetical protein